PTREMDMRARASELLGEPRERLRAVDQYLERAPGARRRLARGPELPVGGIERPPPVESPQPALVMTAHHLLGDVPDCLVDSQPHSHRHTSCPCSPSPH